MNSKNLIDGQGWQEVRQAASHAAWLRCGEVPITTQEERVDLLSRAVTQPMAPAIPLSKQIVPSDRVVIPLETGLPDAPCALAAVIGELCRMGVEPAKIQVLRTDKEARLAPCHPRTALPPEIAQQIEWPIHQRHDRTQLSYLASTGSDHRVYVHSSLCEADFVLPVGRVRPLWGSATYSVHASWFPRFSDAETWKRLRPEQQDGQQACLALQQEADEVGWLLGNPFLLQLVPGDSGHLVDACAGGPRELQREAWQRYLQHWQCALPQRVPFAVAQLSGGRAEQTWNNLLRVMWQAQWILDEGGVLAIHTDLTSTPHRDVRRLGRVAEWQAGSHRRRRADGRPSRLAEALIHATANWRVYLLSGLPESTVESLHMIPVGNAHDLARLVARQAGGLVWSNAQYSVPYVAEEDAWLANPWLADPALPRMSP